MNFAGARVAGIAGTWAMEASLSPGRWDRAATDFSQGRRGWDACRPLLQIDDWRVQCLERSVRSLAVSLRLTAVHDTRTGNQSPAHHPATTVVHQNSSAGVNRIFGIVVRTYLAMPVLSYRDCCTAPDCHDPTFPSARHPHHAPAQSPRHHLPARRHRRRTDRRAAAQTPGRGSCAAAGIDGSQTDGSEESGGRNR